MNLTVAAEILLKGIEAYGRFAAAQRKAKEEGRTSLTPEEVAEFRRHDDERRDALQAEIDRQLAERGEAGDDQAEDDGQ